MAGKIFTNSRYAKLTPVLENDGLLIFVPPRRPLENTEYPDNIVHTVRESDRLDLISTLYYGVPDYGWVISDFNNFLFGDRDLKNNVQIILPSRVTLFTEILPNLPNV